MFKIRLNGGSALVHAPTAGVRAGTYLSWKVKDPKKIVNLFKESVECVTEAYLEYIGDRGASLSLFAKRWQIADCVRKTCRSNKLLDEINARIQTYNKEVKDHVNQFESIKVVSEENTINFDRRYSKAIERLEEMANRGLPGAEVRNT